MRIISVGKQNLLLVLFCDEITEILNGKRATYGMSELHIKPGKEIPTKTVCKPAFDRGSIPVVKSSRNN
jgi:hypothetical protein